MDTFSHALWGWGLFGRRHAGLALFFGALPDLVSFAPLLAGRLLMGTWVPGRPSLATIPGWCFFMYDLAHSAVIAGLAVFLLWRWRRDIGFVACGWLFHILLDFPFHSAAYFPTKLFWPLSGWVFDGISWGQPIVWYPNLAGLLLLLGWRWWQRCQRCQRVR
ncbi:MAG: hypothetical protein JXR59_07425 [Desulfuromonadaceae bacterium]|nr:hypothetical protein [Desulfuromonadaceae bacterium]